MKVLHLLASNRFSGAENVVCQIIDMFRDEPTIEMAYCSPDGPIAGTLQEKNVVFFPMKKLNIKELSKVLKEYKPDIIHAHDMRASFIASFFHYPVVSHIHGNHLELRKISIQSLLYLWASRKFIKIIFVSQSCLDDNYFKKHYNKKSIVLKNVINAQKVISLAQEDPMKYNIDAVFLGRLSEVKDPKRLLSITELVVHEIPDFKLGIVGDGPMREELESIVENKNLKKNVIFYGFQKNPYSILSQSKVMIMCSKYEGLPMALLEAFALGIPVVSTPTDGAKEVIWEGENGYIRNDNREIAQTIINILKNKDQQKSLIESTINISKRINDLKNYKQQLLNVYYKNND